LGNSKGRGKEPTSETALMILDPPEAPTIIFTFPLLFNTIVGDADDWGRLPGFIKFAGVGFKPYALVRLGVEKSSIWLLNTIPDVDERSLLPKLYKNK
jgi:hypothetical protein